MPRGVRRITFPAVVREHVCRGATATEIDTGSVPAERTAEPFSPVALDIEEVERAIF